MVATGPWVLTPLAGAVIGIGGVAVGVIGCLLTIFYSRTSRSRRRLLFNRSAVYRNPSINTGQPGHRECEFRLHLAGPTDIRPDDFINAEPLSFRIRSGRISEVLPSAVFFFGSAVCPPAVITGRYLEIPPTWLPAGHDIVVRLAARGHVKFEADRWHLVLADVQVRPAPRWRPKLGSVSIGSTVFFFVAAPFAVLYGVLVDICVSLFRKAVRQADGEYRWRKVVDDDVPDRGS
jgi:hypothetical protein